MGGYNIKVCVSVDDWRYDGAFESPAKLPYNLNELFPIYSEN